MANLRVLNAFWLKIIMVVLMVLDHLYYNLFPDTLYWGHVAARMVAPMFAFLMTEGLYHTRNRRAYIRRLIAFGVGMGLGNLLLALAFGRIIQSNILLTLAISAALIVCVEGVRSGLRSGFSGTGALYLAMTALCLWLSVGTEGFPLIQIAALIFYFLRHRRALMLLVYAGAMALTCALLIPGSEQIMMVFAVIPILLYNGQRGPGGPVAKYFFYIFYPVHIWIIYLAEIYLGKI